MAAEKFGADAYQHDEHAMKPKLLLGLALILSGGLFGRATANGQFSSKPREPANEALASGATHFGAEILKPRSIELAIPSFDVVFWGQTNLYGVRIVWDGQRDNEPIKQPDSSIRNIQVWLLQSDGTCISQIEKPGFCWVGNLGYVHDEMIFAYSRAPTNEVVGMVLRYRGKLYCKDIEPAKP
ncbi:MAG TPA: hypothetical protein VK742_13705 [Candidatus Sulfotelmatobacter sp.]|jgi:hypothetical protein|nr:hypothetical protein [Candidatus Sulfotelmatobacter sp.]